MDRANRYRNAALALVLGLLAFRILMVGLSPSGLHGDEAQYWAWSKELAGGYYSKPPLVAWVIAATTGLFGDAEWAVRIASPLLHAGAGALAFSTASRLYGAKAGLWASALYLLMPGVTLSSSLISTDALLLFWVALALNLWVRLRERPCGDTVGTGPMGTGLMGMGLAVALGAAIGFGFLSKYAMMFILPALLGAALFEPRTRAALLGWRGAVAVAVALIVFSPNLVWNARNSFATLSHTGDNANLSDGAGLHPGEWLEFFGGQFGVFGPVKFAALLVALVWAARRRADLSLWLALAVVTPLFVISVQALLSRANANWAAAAYGAAPVLLAGWAVQGGMRVRVLLAGLAVNVVLAVVPPVILLSPAWTDRTGFANSVKRQRGWPATTALLRAELERGSYAALAVDQRLMFYDLLYYGIEDTAPLRMWRYEPRVSNHAELSAPLPQGAQGVLLASFYFESYEPYFRADFDSLERVRDIEVELGGGKVRRLRLYRASGYRGPRRRGR